MKIVLSKNDEAFLREKGIVLKDEYTEEEAFSLLDAVYAIEVFYAQGEENKGFARLANIYAGIADRIQAQIP